jgi:transposase
MGNPRGVRRDFAALERRRLQAVKLFGKQLNNSEIGRRLKVSNQTVSRWRKQHQQGGDKALRQAGRAGRLPRLSPEQKARLIELLKQGPEKLGYETPLWTCERVAHLIEKNFHVDYHRGHVWRILRQLGWSIQQPVGRALERNEGRVEDWKRNRWPAIKKKPRKKAAPSFSSTKAD